MPEDLLSGHEPGVRVSQQEETYKLLERVYKGGFRMEPSLARTRYPPQQKAAPQVPQSSPSPNQAQAGLVHAKRHIASSPNIRAAV
jgi:hypothetical protein